MKKIRVQDAVGMTLCHDLTEMRDGFKGPAFRRGHVIREEDIPVLLDVGKEHVFVWENDGTMLHEDEAAEELWAMMQSPGLTRKGPKEGKIDVYAERAGLLKVDSARLRLVNRAGRMMIATRHGNTAVHAGDKVAGARIIPLVIEASALRKVRQEVGEEPLLKIVMVRGTMAELKDFDL